MLVAAIATLLLAHSASAQLNATQAAAVSEYLQVHVHPVQASGVIKL
jgi:hypothetical protein